MTNETGQQEQDSGSGGLTNAADRPAVVPKSGGGLAADAGMGRAVTRVGKVARLPREVRDELNRRIEDGATGPDLLAWLNARPEVKRILRSKFGGNPVTEQNLSEWRMGGFRDWQAHQQRLEWALAFGEQSKDIKDAAGNSVAGAAAALLASRYVDLIQTLGTIDLADTKCCDRLHRLCADIVALRRLEQKSW